MTREKQEHKCFTYNGRILAVPRFLPQIGTQFFFSDKSVNFNFHHVFNLLILKVITLL